MSSLDTSASVIYCENVPFAINTRPQISELTGHDGSVKLEVIEMESLTNTKEEEEEDEKEAPGSLQPEHGAVCRERQTRCLDLHNTLKTPGTGVSVISAAVAPGEWES